MKRRTNLGAKLLVPLIAAVVLSIALVVGISLAICGKGLSTLSLNYSKVLAEDYALQVESKLALTLTTAEALSRNISTVMKGDDAQRTDVLDLVAGILGDHPELVGIGVGFDPNAFDGQDSKNIGQKHSDETGRFVPYTFREGSTIDYTLLAGYDDPGPDGSWYSVPKSTNKTYVTAPYWYEVGSSKYLIVTCVAPILNDSGTFIGMVGFDTVLSSLNEILADAKIFDTGYIVFIAPDGTVAYHPNSELNGTSVYGKLPVSVTDTIDRVYTEGKALSITDKLSDSGPMSQIDLTPIQVGESGGKWIVATSAPLSEINKSLNTSVILAISIGIVVIVIIILFMLSLIRRIVIKPVGEISAAANELAQGHLNIKLSHHSNDELGALADSIQSTGSQLTTYVSNISETLDMMSCGDFTARADIDYVGDLMPIKIAINSISERMNDTLTKIKLSSDEVASGSVQVSDSAQSLSAGTTEQAGSLQELAASISEISTQVNDNAQHAKDASDKANLVAKEITQSNAKMQEMVQAITQISDSSKKIGKIIKTIEDIAFQTNILALNAAVEAARAGTAGKGFAVVADEVRSLASKSAEASKDTASLVESSISAVAHGTAIAHTTAESLVSAVGNAREVASTIDKISVSSDDQARSITLVTQGVEQISSVVLTNSATAEESSATSEALSEQAQILKSLVSDFTL